MDKPGLQRALPYMLVTFILSLMFVYGIRSLQNMDPIWVNADTSEGAQVGLVLAAFASMAAFLLGMGAFDPKMSEHGDHSDEHEAQVAPETEFQLRQDGWLYHIGNVQYQFGLLLLDAKTFSPTFRLPDDGSNPISMLIGYILWIPLWVVLTIFAAIMTIVIEIKNIKYTYINLSNIFINGIFNFLLLPIWVIGAVLTRVILGGVAGLWLTLGIPLLAISWALQIVRFYMGQFLVAIAVSVGVVVAMFAFALLPTGFRLQTTSEPNADMAANGVGEFVVPIQEVVGLLDPGTSLTNQPIPETSQFAVLLGFIIIIFISLALAGGLIALFFYIAHQGIKEVQEVPRTDEDLTPPHVVWEVGKVASFANRIIYAIPEFIGYKK